MPQKGENIYKRKDGRWKGCFIKEYDITLKALYGYVYGKTYTEISSNYEKLRSTKRLIPRISSTPDKFACIK